MNCSLKEQNRLLPPMQRLLANLDRLAAGDRASLAALCGVGRDGIDKLIAELRALDPKPGLAFAHEPVRTLIPDVFVRAAPSGGWIVELNDEVLPRLIVNRAYYAEVSARLSGEADRKYLADCLQKASWLEKSLDQRARTVLKVATEIVRRQEGFLRDGVAHLKPLNLRMVADALGIHESTVSRAAANKTIATAARHFRFPLFLHRLDRRHGRRRGAFGRGGEASDPQDDRWRSRPMRCFPTMQSSPSCRARGSTSRVAPSPNIARSCASARRSSGGAKGGSKRRREGNHMPFHRSEAMSPNSV